MTQSHVTRPYRSNSVASFAHIWCSSVLFRIAAAPAAVRSWLRSDEAPPPYWNTVRKAHNVIGYIMVSHGCHWQCGC